jgi:hypothetical protein
MQSFWGWSVWNRSKPAQHHKTPRVREIPITPDVEAEYLKKWDEASQGRRFFPLFGATTSRNEK